MFPPAAENIRGRKNRIMNNKNNVKPATPAKPETKPAPGQPATTGQHTEHKAKDPAEKAPTGNMGKDGDEKSKT